MPDATELTKAMKKAAVKAVEAGKPVEIYFAKVTSVSPLQILVDQKFTLGAAQLVLTRSVTDFTTNVTINQNTGMESVTIHNGLVVGDEVILIRKQGGQKYVVVDRIG